MYVNREIYEIHLAYVNSDGFHATDPNLGGTQYPIIVDSKTRNNDIEKTLRAAMGYLGAAESTIAKRDDQVSYVYIIRVSDGQQIEKRMFGKISQLDIPDPEPEPETEPEQGGEGE